MLGYDRMYDMTDDMMIRRGGYHEPIVLGL
jgi:hypothetical protein